MHFIPNFFSSMRGNSFTLISNTRSNTDFQTYKLIKLKMHLNTLEILKALCILILPQIIFQLMKKIKLYISEDDGALNEKNELYLIII